MRLLNICSHILNVILSALCYPFPWAPLLLGRGVALAFEKKMQILSKCNGKRHISKLNAFLAIINISRGDFSKFLEMSI